jgi:hypothetical protein
MRETRQHGNCRAISFDRHRIGLFWQKAWKTVKAMLTMDYLTEYWEGAQKLSSIAKLFMLWFLLIHFHQSRVLDCGTVILLLGPIAIL